MRQTRQIDSASGRKPQSDGRLHSRLTGVKRFRIQLEYLFVVAIKNGWRMNRRNILVGAGGALLLAGAGTFAWKSAVGSMADYRNHAGRLRARLPQNPEVVDLIRFATLAANGHNTQPWLFRVEKSVIEILPDHSRRTPVVDPDDHHLFVSLGCAAENLLIAANASGRPGDLETAEGKSGVRFRYSDGQARSEPLLAAIPARQSTRAEFDRRSLPAADMKALEQAGAIPGVRMVILAERQQIDGVRDLVIAGNSTQMADPAFVRELKQWLRFNPRGAMAAGDGLFAAASANPVLPNLLGGIAFERFFTIEGENDKYARHIGTSVGIAVFMSERDDEAHWIAAGRACQRFALTATSLGVKHAFINQPVEVARLRPELAALVGESGKRPDIVMRFGYGPVLPYSLRRPVEAVMVEV